MTQSRCFVRCLILGLLFSGSCLATTAVAQSVGLPAMQNTSQHSQFLLQKTLGGMESQFEIKRSMLKKIEVEIDVLQDSRGKIDDFLFEANVTPQSFPTLVAMLQSTRIQLKIDLAGLNARQNLLREAIQSPPADLKLKQRKLEIALKMRGLAAQRLEQAKRLHAAGTLAVTELSSIEEELQNAELRVLEMEDAMLESSQTVGDMNLQAGIELAEKEARLAAVESMLQATAGSRDAVQRAEAEARELQQLQEQRLTTLRSLQELEEQISGAKAELLRLQSEVDDKEVDRN